MKEDLNKILAKAQPAIAFVKRYATFGFVIVMLGIFGFLVFRINQFSRLEPTDAAVQQELNGVQKPKIDQSALDKIQQLQDQNVQVQSLFNQARNNPFNE